MIKASLTEEFGEISVNLEANPKEVTVEIKNEAQEQKFKDEMKDIGFDVIEE
ncbi:heavy metal transport/detoxification protein [Candidatus Marinarcus aquaticus]|uniref:Heavy metal transport/detoxification protein n=2 Tax=Candidatus Marinarcus aquaticus TaxID=2044504 RepID=A0A4Q0XSS5_9BACT|nr:heavy metal transport/detoxification protein [Candidatus Marinarcus aquaticus]